MQSFSKVQALVSGNGGQSIFGWGKQGVMNNKILLGCNDAEENKILADNVKTHIACVRPSNAVFDDSS